MKKITVKLAALDKVDDKPLRKSLEIIRKAWREIDDAKDRLAALEKEVEDFLNKADPDDEKALHLAASKRMQIEIIPRLISKVEHNLEEEISPSMEANLDRFKTSLRQFYEQAFEVTEEEMAKFFKPYFSDQVESGGTTIDRALKVARECDDCRELQVRIREVESQRLPATHRSGYDLRKFDANLCELADHLLALAARD